MVTDFAQAMIVVTVVDVVSLPGRFDKQHYLGEHHLAEPGTVENEHVVF